MMNDQLTRMPFVVDFSAPVTDFRYVHAADIFCRLKTGDDPEGAENTAVNNGTTRAGLY